MCLPSKTAWTGQRIYPVWSFYWARDPFRMKAIN
jgi:hypothetical protein